MATYNISAGHNFKVPGASGYFSETVEDRNVKNLIVSKLRAMGHTVYDCTDEDGRTQSQNLANIVAKCNSHSVNLDVSIHFNAASESANGVEVLVYSSGSKAKPDAQRICDSIAALGFRNRGVKVRSDLYVLRRTKSPALLVECAFCTSQKDAKLYNAESMANAIVKGITGVTVNTTSAPKPAAAPVADSGQMYRIRKTWADAKSQLGAYRGLDGAKKQCPVGYSVFDKDGNAVYSNVPAVTETTQIYRVRKSWENAKSQLGAYSVLDNAKAQCPDGYTVYDKDGNAVYAPEIKVAPVVNDEPKVEEKPAEKPSEAVVEQPDISPIKGIDKEVFIAYIGNYAKNSMEKQGVCASVTIAQAILESNWGQSELSLKANNLFGMKSNLSGNSWASEWDGKIYTKYSPEDDSNGNVTQVKSDFRAYGKPSQSIIDHSNYLIGAKKGDALRYEGLVGEKDYRKAIQIIKDGGYATDSKYVDKICKLIEEYGLDTYDCVADPSDDLRQELDDIKKSLSGVPAILDVIVKAVKSLADIFAKFK